MASTALDIINPALAEMGRDAIVLEPREDINDPEIQATLDDDAIRALAVYNVVRPAALARYPWSWLTERAQLTSASGYDGTNEPYRYRFEVPVGVQIRALYDAESDEQPMVDEWRRQGRFLYANVRQVWYDKQRADIDESVFPDAFANALVLEMVARLALSITYDIPTARLYEQRAEVAWREAERLDVQGTPNEAVVEFDWVNERVGGGHLGRGRRFEGPGAV